MATIFHHNGFALVALHIGQGLRQDAGIVAEAVGQ